MTTIAATRKQQLSSRGRKTMKLPLSFVLQVSATAVIVGTAAVVAFVPTSPCSFSTSTTTTSPGLAISTTSRRPIHTTTNGYNRFLHSQQCQTYRGSSINNKRSTELFSFMGSDGGILGIGTPELFTILLVGYFVLGPSDLYKLVKEVGKFVQNFRTFTTEATANLENTFESQLQLEEIRKAQRELNDAFSFRRSINVDADTDPFEVNVQTPRGTDDISSSTISSMEGSAEGAASAVASLPTKKKIRRRVKKKKDMLGSEDEDFDFGSASSTDTELQKLANNVPDLNLDDEDDLELARMQQRAEESMRLAQEELWKEKEEDEERERTRAERMQRLQGNQQQSLPPLNGNRSDVLSEESKNPQAALAEQSRFQKQLSGDWNDQILEKDDELAPLASIMDRLALLEDEKAAADRRLQEEFKLREENEERYYREKRALLEEAAAKVQAEAYNLSEK